MPRIRAITLDLDDTLWPSAPVLMRAEQRAYAWLQEHAPPVAAAWPLQSLRELRMSVYKVRPELHHNLLQVRRIALHQAFEQAGMPESQTDELIEQSLSVFMNARNDVNLYPEVLDCLTRLSGRYALASLTNGNADVVQIGLGHFFKAVVSAHTHGTTKPDPAIFHMACRELDCAPEEVVHVGDDINLDVRGARAAGLQAVWMNRGNADWSGDDAPAAVNDLLEFERWITLNTGV